MSDEPKQSSKLRRGRGSLAHRSVPKNLKSNNDPAGPKILKHALAGARAVFGGEEIPSKQTVLRVLGALMYGEFHHWECLKDLRPDKQLDGILYAADKLMKAHGGYQKASENDRDKRFNVLMGGMHAAYELLQKDNKPNGPDEVWAEMLAWAEREDKAKGSMSTTAELHELEQQLRSSYLAFVKQREQRDQGYVN